MENAELKVISKIEKLQNIFENALSNCKYKLINKDFFEIERNSNGGIKFVGGCLFGILYLKEFGEKEAVNMLNMQKFINPQINYKKIPVPQQSILNALIEKNLFEFNFNDLVDVIEGFDEEDINSFAICDYYMLGIKMNEKYLKKK